ncbi:GumC family protein [Ancylobacter amanitiformis]|uniref:GumC family protein n=1 Tax=Ancylobacter amanitiformis TaxID=217069 RepID=UPI0027D7D946|nr:polysaccharide biosynthesis tyrosine autokinase [Ancylobacter amanitiformis]
MHGQIAGVAKQEDSESFDFHHIVDFALRRWLLIVAIASTFVIVAVVISYSLTPRFTSTAQILLDSSSRNNLGVAIMGAEEQRDSTMVDSQIAILTSLNFLKRVVERENLIQDPEFGERPVARSWFDTMRGWLGFAPATRASLADSPGANVAAKGDISPAIRDTVARLRAALTVERVTRTPILSVSVTSISPQKASNLANAIADAYIVDQLENRYEAARRASSWLSDRLQSLREGLRKSEQAVQKFRSDNNLVSVDSRTLNEQQLSEVNAELVQIQTEAAGKLAKYEQARQLMASGGKVEAIPDVMSSGVISDLRGRLAATSAREADLVSRYGERHPLVVNVRAERREIERLITGEISRIVANLKNDYEVAKSRADAMSANVAAVSGQTTADNALTVHLRELERDADANRTLYETFLGQAKLTSEQSEVTIQDARIITPAVVSSAPSFPKKKILVAVGGLLGVMAGIGIALLMEMLNAGFNSPRQVEESTGLPVLSSIEWVDLSGEKGKDSVPVLDYLISKPLSRFSESVRSLRAGVQMSDVDNPPQVIELTSASPGEGKTSLAIALAVSAATSGKRVLLIDCDLRRPSVSQQFGLTERAGLVELLAQTASSEGILYRDKSSGLYVLGSGAKTQSPPDLLSSGRMQSLVEQLRQSFDLIVLDAPPIGPVVDAAVLAPIADKLVFVVRWNSTAREFVRHSLERLAGDRKVCGIAFNMVDLRRTPKYGRYSYYSSAYYKKYYVG